MNTSYIKSFGILLGALLLAGLGMLNGLKAQDSGEFVENNKQYPQKVKFAAGIQNGKLFIEDNALVYSFYEGKATAHAHSDDHLGHEHHSVTRKSIPETDKINCHAYKVLFSGSQRNISIQGLEQQESYVNFFHGNNPEKWDRGCKIYKKIRYLGLYRGIDLVMYRQYGNLKYDFMLSAGADASRIKLQFEGAGKMTVKNGELLINTTINQIIEGQPKAWQEIEGAKVPVECNYKLQNNELSFKFPDGYNKAYPLIIDPELIFSTFSGSEADNWGFTGTYDNDGNVYGGGIVAGMGYPTSLGAFQVEAGELWDVGVIKYSPNGKKRLYATYLGGSSSEMPHSFIVNEFNELLIFGTTGSSDFPVSAKAFNRTFNGGDSLDYMGVHYDNGIDIFVARLSEDGTDLPACTYVGGSENDGLNFTPGIDYYGGNGGLYYNYGDGARGEIIKDKQNNVYIGTCTYSSDFPVRGTAFQTTYKGGLEGIVFKLDYNLSNMVWGSFIGGDKDDAVFSIDVDKNYDLYITGGTMSTPANGASSNFPITSGAYKTQAPGGNVDAFISKISQDGRNLMASTFFGSNKYDQAYFVRSDKYNHIYIFGQTEAEGSTLIYNAKYNKPNSGQFLAKFAPALDSLEWSTVFGTGSGKPNISPTAFSVDICQRIYLSGSGREWGEWVGWKEDPNNPGQYIFDFGWDNIEGTKGMEVTPDAYQNITDGQDFYIMVMQPEAEGLDYATFFGEQFNAYCEDINSEAICSGCIPSGRDHVDGGTSRFDKTGNIYQSVCASCGGCQSFPTSPGVWSNSNNSGNCNNAVFKFNIHNDILLANFNQPDIGCAPHEIEFKNTSTLVNPEMVSYTWDFGDGNKSKEKHPSHTFLKAGKYNVSLVVQDLTSCNFVDTIIKEVLVLSNTSHREKDVVICPGKDTLIGISPKEDPNTQYQWIPDTGISDASISNPYVSTTQSRNYRLVVSNGLCADTIYHKVVVDSVYAELLAKSDVSCQGNCDGQIHVKGIGYGDINYTWDNGKTGNLLKNICPGSYSVQLKDSLGCMGTGIFEIGEPEILKVHIIDTTQVNCGGECTGKLVARAQGGTAPYAYSWNNGEEGATAANLCEGRHKVTVIDKNDCQDTTSAVLYPQSEINVSIAHKENILCFGECSGVIELAIKGIGGPYIYEWEGLGEVNTNKASGLCAGEYKVKVLDKYGCQKSIATKLDSPEKLKGLVVQDENIACFGGTTTIKLEASGGLAPYSYLWLPANEADSVLENVEAGEYTAVIQDKNLCADTSKITITQPNDISFESTPLGVSCNGACNGALNLRISGGTLPYTTTLNGSVVDGSSLIEGLCEDTYLVEVTDKNACKQEKEIAVGNQGYKPPLIIEASENTIIQGNEVQLTATPGYASYIWEPASGLDFPDRPNPLASPNATTTYTLRVTDEQGCQSLDTISIEVREILCEEPYIFVPNAFTPDNNENNNHILYVRGNYITELYFAIYNRWGELVFETRNQNKGWDGTYKGEKVQPGVFVYYLKATCMNNEVFKKKGNITLLR